MPPGCKSFQKSVGLKQTGVVNDPTWIALIAYGSKPTLSAGDRGANVVRLQRALRAAGYKTLTGTGYYGQLTATAVKKVQRGNGFKATGMVGPKFWTLLQSGRLKPGRNASPAPSAPASSKGSSKGAMALAFAKRQIGDSYGYGGTGPNRWDCSGLTQARVQGGRRQAAAQRPRSDEVRQDGRQVRPQARRPGVLLLTGPPCVALRRQRQGAARLAAG